MKHVRRGRRSSVSLCGAKVAKRDLVRRSKGHGCARCHQRLVEMGYLES